MTKGSLGDIKSILPQFWTSNTHEVTRGLQWSADEFAFYHSFERPTRPKWRKGCSATSRICILPQFWASDTSEVTKGSLGQVREFAFYHSFERPTRPKWRKGRAAKWEICVLPQFWASDTHEVTRGSIGDVKNLRFTSVLSVRHARSDERVVKSTGAIPAPQTEKNRF